MCTQKGSPVQSYPACVEAVSEMAPMSITDIYSVYKQLALKMNSVRDADTDHGRPLTVEEGASRRQMTDEHCAISAQMLLQEVEAMAPVDSDIFVDGVCHCHDADNKDPSSAEGESGHVQHGTDDGAFRDSQETATPQPVQTPVVSTATTSTTPGDCPHHEPTQQSISKGDDQIQVLPSASASSGTATATAHDESKMAVEDSTEERSQRKRFLKEKLVALRAENRKLKARQVCRQCHQRPVALTFLPCGHFCYCEKCGSSFEVCPVCKRTILADVRTIVS